MTPESSGAPLLMATIAVTGAAGTLGRRVLRSLGERPDVGGVVAIDLVEPPGSDLLPDVTPVLADLAGADVATLLRGVDAVVHLAADGDEHGTRGAADRNLAIARRVLAGASAAGVPHLVLVSSAAVYGAWPANPVPLTEAEPVRPAPEFGFAVEKAELERLGAEWAREGGEGPGRTFAVLRPAPAVSGGAASWLARSLFAALPFRSGPAQPPLQFVHLDDLAAAVALAAAERLDGLYNVAPDGWVDAERVRALAGAPPRLPVPLRFATGMARWSWRLRVGATPPGLVPYTMHPWVVASDRLRSAGWRPAWSNEEAFVDAHPGTWWSRLSPKRRQELTLGIAGSAIAGAAAAGVRALWRHRHR